MSKLADFLINSGKTDAGLTFEDIMYLRDAELELHHDWIQWVFPSPKGSRVIPNSPILTQEDFDALKKEYYHLDRLVIAKNRYLRFLEDTDYWMADHDHNHLRITRAIECLSLFRGQDYATEFYDAVFRLLARADRDVNKDSKLFWIEATFYGKNQRAIKWK